MVAVLAALFGAPARAEAPPPPRPQAPAEVCGDAALVGTLQPAIVEAGGCGIAAPVRLSAAAGVALDPPAVVACDTAQALAVWLDQGPKPDFAARGAALAALTVVDAYSCRARNRAAEGRLSEHALGRAIDIAGFRLRDGTNVTIRDGWGSPAWGAVLRRIHDAGCGPFGTVLGPEANPLHADHLHLDVEVRRSGPYCE